MDCFGRCSAQSPTLSEKIYDVLTLFEKKTIYQNNVRIYLDTGRYDLVNGTIGNETFLSAATGFHAVIDRSGIPNRFGVVNDGHEWANWRERTGEALMYLFGPEAIHHP